MSVQPIYKIPPPIIVTPARFKNIHLFKLAAVAIIPLTHNIVLRILPGRKKQCNAGMQQI